MSPFNKGIDELVAADLESLVDRGLAESEVLEYKEDIPSKRGIDPWYQGKKVTDYGRDKLLKEIVAFANSLGGTLIIGMSETSDSPPRPAQFAPVPRCTQLALLIDQMAGSCIEPQIPHLRVRGVPVDASGRGLVVLEVGRSTLAPHRLYATRECYTRRGERTERLTMREIRDLVLTSRDLADFVDRRFRRAAREFESLVDRHETEVVDVRGVSVAAVPLNPDRIAIDVYDEVDLPDTLPQVSGTSRSDDVSVNFAGFLPNSPSSWRPLLRGAVFATEPSETEFQHRLEVFNNGDVHYRLMLYEDSSSKGMFFPEWLVGSVAIASVLVDKLRAAAHEASVEYGIEVIFRRHRAARTALQPWGLSARAPGVDMPERIVFPQYRYRGEISELLNFFVRDMWNAIEKVPGLDAEARWSVIG